MPYEPASVAFVLIYKQHFLECPRENGELGYGFSFCKQVDGKLQTSNFILIKPFSLLEG
jgi:hypothetical protein